MWDLKSLEQNSGGSYNWILKLCKDLMNNDLCLLKLVNIV